MMNRENRTSPAEAMRPPVSGDRAPIKLPWEWPERLLSLTALLGLIALGAVTAWAWPRLPTTIPIHFNLSGQPDGWGDRLQVLFLPLTTLALYALLSFFAGKPHLYKYPWPITPENVRRQYRLARGLILALRVAVVAIFLHITAGTISVVPGGAAGLGTWSCAQYVLGIGLLMGIYLAAARRGR